MKFVKFSGVWVNSDHIQTVETVQVDPPVGPPKYYISLSMINGRRMHGPIAGAEEHARDLDDFLTRINS